jgi:septum formation protein
MALKMVRISGLIGLKYPLILASKSPRRQHLLKQLGFDFLVKPSNVNEENEESGASADEFVRKLAQLKAWDVAEKIKGKAIIIGADTVVVLDGQMMNKPMDAGDAINMLKKLSGRTHIVHTGIALVEPFSKKCVSSVKSTHVTFRELDEDEIKAYVAAGSPMDKAGAYGIQDDFGAVFVSHIEGCYYNIVGLPLEMLYSMMREFVREV